MNASSVIKRTKFTAAAFRLTVVWLLLMSVIYDPACAASQQKIGIFYLLWHGPASSSRHYHPSGIIFDNSEILKGKGDWGPIHAFHWWGKPAAGYYCLAENDDLLRKHAEMLRDAGIDFVFIDSSNQPNQAGSGPMIIDPFDKMIEIWSQVPGAPKIVPWLPITGEGDMIDYFDRKMSEHPQMAFIYQGKPLLLAVAPKSKRESAQFKALESRYTIRQMWGLLNPEQLKSGEWSFMQPCDRSFKSRGGNEICNQGISYHNGLPEQISVTAAYQFDYTSNTDPKSPSSAVPKLNGRTLIRQLQTAYLHPEVPIVTITGWNEWIAQRQFPGGKFEHFPNGNKVFVDSYNNQYNRDLEPGGELGDYYYKLLKRAIALLRSGKDPIMALPRNCW